LRSWRCSGGSRFPRFAATFQWAFLQIAEVLGDSYVFSESPFRREAIVGSVLSQMRDLATRCGHLVVLAHSQGAAVAAAAVYKELPEQLRLFVTYGSGLQRLEELSPDEDDAATDLLERPIIAAMFLSGVAFASLVQAVLEWYGWSDTVPTNAFGRHVAAPVGAGVGGFSGGNRANAVVDLPGAVRRHDRGAGHRGDLA
jgi:hypothetical protein